MRHIVLALMIVLLPLRGWAGDAMATQTATQMATQLTGVAVAMESGAAHALIIRSTGSFNHHVQGSEPAQVIPDCHGQMTSHTDAHDKATNDHSGTCQACQACHTVALSPSPVVLANVFVSPPMHPPLGATFTSAATTLSQKPPIS